MKAAAAQKPAEGKETPAVKAAVGAADAAGHLPHVTDDDVLLTARQRRKEEREARRQAKDAAYELRRQRKKNNDGTSSRGHNIVDGSGLAEAFPDHESTELESGAVRRRITHGVVLVLLLALLVTGLVLAGMIQRGELELTLGPGKPTPTPESCPAEKLDYPANKSVSVNVYNASTKEGRAGTVAEELKKRGFTVKTVANARTQYSAPAVVISGPSGHAAAFALQRNLPNTDYVQDERKDSTVDVVLTGSFAGFVAVPKVDETPGVLSCPRLAPKKTAPATARSTMTRCRVAAARAARSTALDVPGM